MQLVITHTHIYIILITVDHVPHVHTVLTRLLGRPQPQMYPPVALNQYVWVNRTHKHFIYIYFKAL